MNAIVSRVQKYFEQNKRVVLFQCAGMSAGLSILILSFTPEHSSPFGFLPAANLLAFTIFSLLTIAAFNAGIYRSRRAEMQEQLRSGARLRSVVLQLAMENVIVVFISAVFAVTLSDLTFRIVQTGDGLSMEKWIQEDGAVFMILGWSALAFGFISLPIGLLKLKKPSVISLKLTPFAVSLPIVLPLLLASFNLRLVETFKERGDLPCAIIFLQIAPALAGIAVFILYETLWNKRWVSVAWSSRSNGELSRIITRLIVIFLLSLLPAAVAGGPASKAAILAGLSYGLIAVAARQSIVWIKRKRLKNNM